METQNTNTNEGQGQSLVPAYDPKSAYWDGSHPDHAAAVAAVRGKFQAKYDGVAPGNPRTVDLDGKPVEITFNAGLLADLEAMQAGRDPKNTTPAFTLEEPATAPVGTKLGDEALADFSQFARGMGLDGEQAQGVLDAYGSFLFDSKEPAEGWTMESSREAVRKMWNERAVENLDLIGRYTAANPKLSKWLDDSGMGNSPEVLSVLLVMAKQADGSLGAYDRELESAYWSGSDPRHQEAVRARLTMRALKLK